MLSALKSWRVLAGLALLLVPTTGTVHAQERIALVIGNNNYYWLGKLQNAENDARDIATVLRSLRFSVTLEQNQSLAAMSASIGEFLERLRLNPSSVAVFYYAGHGLEAKGVNYLVPVEARIKTPEDIEKNVVNLSQLIRRLGGRDRVSIVILDACRADPFFGVRKALGVGKGFAGLVGPRGSIIAYATAPGEYASDGNPQDKNGPFAKALKKYLPIENLKVEELFKLVRVSVIEETNGEQVPWEASSLTGDFLFAHPR